MDQGGVGEQGTSKHPPQVPGLVLTAAHFTDEEYLTKAEQDQPRVPMVPSEVLSHWSGAQGPPGP